MSLVDVNEINEALGIDLQSKLGKGQNNTTYVSRWVEEREDDILLFIGDHCWGGRDQLIRYTQNQVARDSIKKAIIYQAQYILDNQSIEKLGGIMLKPNGDLQSIPMEARLDATISPKAYRTLLSAGLLNLNR